MLNAYNGALTPSTPPPPPRYGILHNVAAKPKKDLSTLIWRESIAVIYTISIFLCVTISSISIFYYAQRQKALYEEIVDYLDKTVSISKINYNPTLGFYEIHANEYETLGDLRKFKTYMWSFLFSDLATYAFIIITLFIYYVGDLTLIPIRFVFWLFISFSALYVIAEASVFTTLLYPQINRLQNSTEELLDHAVPFNTGGLMQMERRLECTFNQNLYFPFKRRQNDGNTCDPYIIGSFITRTLLLFFIFCRLICVLIFAALVFITNPIAKILSVFIFKTRPTQRYKNRYTKKTKKNLNSKNDLNTKKSTTFGVNESFREPTPPLGQLDHSISYNNIAFFATPGSAVMFDNSSDISKCDLTDNILKGSIHTTNSLVSEV